MDPINITKQKKNSVKYFWLSLFLVLKRGLVQIKVTNLNGKNYEILFPNALTL